MQYFVIFWGDYFFSDMEIFSLTSVFWAVASIIVAIVTGFVNQVFMLKADWAKRTVSWILSIIFSAVAWEFGIIKFDGDAPIWIGVVALGVVTGLASNGIYSVKSIKNWIKNLSSEEEQG